MGKDGYKTEQRGARFHPSYATASQKASSLTSPSPAEEGDRGEYQNTKRKMYSFRDVAAQITGQGGVVKKVEYQKQPEKKPV